MERTINGMRVLNPSRISEQTRWEGPRAHPEDKFTIPQVREMTRLENAMARNQVRFNLPAEYAVRTHDGAATVDNPLGAEMFILCPVVRGNRDRTRLEVIAPSGDAVWIKWEHLLP